MRVQEHLKLSTVAAVAVSPWLKKDTWIPFVASILIDADHYLWHAVTHRTLSLRAALRFFNQADPPQTSAMKFMHQPLFLALLLFAGVRLRSRLLLLILAGLLFHVSLDVVHASQMSRLKRTLREAAHNTCPECGQFVDDLQLHTVHYTRNLLDRYNSRHFVVLCPTCHEKAHASSHQGEVIL
jgi:hypothetical protein